MARKKVHVPKVVVQSNPPSRVLLFVLLLAAFAAVARLSYDYGRSQGQPVESAELASNADAGQRVKDLEAQRDALKEQLAGLQRDARLSREALEVARNKIRDLERQQADSTDAPPVEQPAPVAEPADNRLKLQQINIARSDSPDRFRYTFTVVHQGDQQVVGTIWIAVNGLLNGQPTRLQLDKVSSNSRPFVKMDFRQRQEVEGELRLPAAFSPKNISIEAKPYSRKFLETAEKVDWVVE
jgi:Family of unknown function (DUF6776)